MPEIAEVETVRNTLKKHILGKKIKSVEILYSKMIDLNLEEFERILTGSTFQDINRVGKWLLFDIGDYYLLSHLRMEGKYFLKKSNEPIEKHEHIIFHFEDKTDLRYHDIRKFGRMDLVKKSEMNHCEKIQKQGIEPMDEKLSAEYLKEHFKQKKVPIKTLLLDQTIISGLGNIYANEVLFHAKINPFRLGNTLSLKECERIKIASNEVIASAIKDGGTTIKSYTSSLGVTGMFQQKLMVHKREKETCKICNSVILREKLAGRSTYYCPNCQK